MLGNRQRSHAHDAHPASRRQSHLSGRQSGSGIRLRDSTGKEYIDASGGAAVSCLGHGHPDVLAAMHAQLDALTYAHSLLYYAPGRGVGTAAHRPGAARHVRRGFLQQRLGGIEACLKLARHYFVEIGEPSRSKFIAHRQSYHGITLGALSIGGRQAARAPFMDADRR